MKKKATEKQHPFMKMAGIKDMNKFMEMYPTEDDFFADYPQAKYGMRIADAGLNLPGGAFGSQDQNQGLYNQQGLSAEDASKALNASGAMGKQGGYAAKQGPVMDPRPTSNLNNDEEGEEKEEEPIDKQQVAPQQPNKKPRKKYKFEVNDGDKTWNPFAKDNNWNTGEGFKTTDMFGMAPAIASALLPYQPARMNKPFVPMGMGNYGTGSRAAFADGGYIAESGIHIDPSKRGTFTAAATKHGKSVQGFASQVLANKENYSPAMVKKANFARNASKWKHEYGGSTMMQKGGPLLPNNPSGYADSVINANQNIPFYKDLKAGKVGKNANVFVYDAADSRAMEDDNINPYAGIRSAIKPKGSYINGAYKELPIGEAYSDTTTAPIYFPSQYAAGVFQDEIQKRIKQDGGYIAQDGFSTRQMPDNPGFRALPSAVQQKIMDNMQTGGMVTDDRMIYGPGGQYMQTGGMINPYHPMAKFLRGGYYQDGGSSSNVTSNDISPEGSQAVVFNAPSNNTPSNAFKTNSSYDPSTDPNNPVNNPPPMPQQGKYAAAQGPVYEGTMDETEKEEEEEEAPTGPSGWDKARNWGNAILGTGMTALGIAGAYADRRDARNLRNKQFNDRSSANMYAAMNQPGGKGDYTQQGIFRPDSMTPTAAGKFYPGMAGSYNQGMGITKYGGGVMNNYTYAHGGYHAGQEVELSDAEIANLKRMGYDIEEL